MKRRPTSAFFIGADSGLAATTTTAPGRPPAPTKPAGVAAQQQGLAAQRLARLGEAGFAASGDRRPRALGQKLPGGFLPHAAGAASAQRIFSFKPLHCALLAFVIETAAL
ncbi:hypothetical protein ACPRNU_21870 [Chromobacterium vaccinii]|uniref:hypothetical protein n=1 Tax=Chromobacterium vaccinii TaxID=1108595 RepID=UPI003C741CAD